MLQQLYYAPLNTILSFVTKPLKIHIQNNLAVSYDIIQQDTIRDDSGMRPTNERLRYKVTAFLIGYM